VRIVLTACLAGAPAFAQQDTTAPPQGEEPALLAALREAEREVEASAQPSAATVAQAASRDGTSLSADTLDATFAAGLQLPTIPLRMTPRLARELTLLRSDTRARRILVSWYRHAARYQSRLQAALLEERLPAALVWVAAAESAFDPRIESSAGAVGLWQLMPDAARTYGLRVDNWVDERRDPDRSTRAAARYLRDLYARFGAWELALAAYNMGYNALLRAIRKYNTNDFEALASAEAGLPTETLHYVPRILGLAVAAHNPAAFDLLSLRPDPVVAWDDVELRASVPLDELARLASVPEAELRALNPALLRSRTPPVGESSPAFVLHVPRGSSTAVRAALLPLQIAPTRAYAVRHGESVEEIATRYGLRASALLSLSGLADDRAVRPGTVLLTPDRDPVEPAAVVQPVIAVESTGPVTDAPAGRARVFVRVAYPDDTATLARSLGVARDDLVRWNHLDAQARLQSGMWLQAWVVEGASPRARVWRETDVELVRRGSELFHDRAVAATGLVRLRVTVREGDTMASLATRYHTTTGRIGRINHIERDATLTPGSTLVVYTDAAHVPEETLARDGHARGADRQSGG